MHRHFVSVVLLLISGSVATVRAQHLEVSMTAQTIDEALRLAADDKTAGKFLEVYVLQNRAGWGDGPLIGRCSTPFSRVVQAAVAARKKGKPFTPADATADLIATEFHVVATSQKAASDDTIVQVYSVMLAARGDKDAADVVAPIKTVALTPEYQEFAGTALKGPGVVAVFPLSSLPANAEIRVVFDQVARGSSAVSRCRECIVPLKLDRMR